ncbi:lipid phosphate phosphatase 2-like isoform X1 [Histomonas meleagridis]|uniref:lipid phosphate phosphatase 2-like isoform X1 n=1 Tax=Histomonas meleagridis TaxID=135588 RepID=UPI00355ACD68|nr:lipid phosphate phosphatase 2-like isoform X1 [Histomonas meleagridis]KAH0797659.1 lipid phosphate phosphatase 2-like isoform X1 [Histomonas meleagridis]
MSKPGFEILKDYPKEGPEVPERQKVHREKDRHVSGTGRTDRIKRQGRGPSNWGDPIKDSLAANEEVIEEEELGEEEEEHNGEQKEYVNPSQYFEDDDKEEGKKQVKKVMKVDPKYAGCVKGSDDVQIVEEEMKFDPDALPKATKVVTKKKPKRKYVPEQEEIVLVIIAGIIANFVEPVHNNAVFENYNERYPYTGETIKNAVLFCIIIIFPCIVLGILALICPRKIELGLAYLSLAQTLVLTLLITEILKVTVARPRPNYFSYCDFDTNSKACHGSKSHQKDAKVSFPSGHASNSFASATWFYLFLVKFLPSGPELWWVLIKFIPIAIAIAISATRITDHMHHVSDVAAGVILGIGIGAAIFSAQQGRIFLSKSRPFDPLAQL